MSTDLVIILSSDWVGSTATRTQLGEDQADALQAYHDRLLRKIVEGQDGTIVKNSGDGVLAIFHSAGQALAGAASIQEQFTAYSEAPGAVAPMRIRVGLSAGDVVHREGDIFGTAVIEAVRLQAAAGAGEILCSELVGTLTRGRGGADPGGFRGLSGIA